MANLEKHKKNPLLEYLDGEESTVPAQPRSSHVLGAYIKIPKASVSGKIRPPVAGEPERKVEPALVRDPAPPAKLEEKRSQANSWEHLRKTDRLANLRAPVTRPSAKPAPASRKAVPVKSSGRSRKGT